MFNIIYRMISINIQGGLGNQIFMIFATLAYGIQYNKKIVFPYHVGTDNRPTYWDTFFDHLNIFTTRNSENAVDVHSFYQYKEPAFSYQPIPYFVEDKVLLLGYFQSPKYFEPYRDTIYQLIHLSDKKKDVLNRHKELFDKKTVSIHFRMGDYKKIRYYHPIMNYEYFEGALTYIMERTDTERVLYFCEKEDNEYVQKQMVRLKNKYQQLEFVKVDDSVPDYQQLLMISCCNHNIMSNSTFSWWGAYMNENPNKLVMYPSVWFGEYFEHSHDYKDMMDSSWVKIEANPIHWQQPL